MYGCGEVLKELQELNEAVGDPVPVTIAGRIALGCIRPISGTASRGPESAMYLFAASESPPSSFYTARNTSNSYITS